MTQINISEGDLELLTDLGKNWFAIPGDKPMPPQKVLHEIIKQKWRDAHPPEYQTPGFDRQ